MTNVPAFLSGLVDAFAAATSSDVDVVHTWAAAQDSPSLIVVGGIDTATSQQFDVGGISGAVTTNRTRSGYGGEQVELVEVTCSLTVPPAGEDSPETVATSTGAILSSLAVALQRLSVPNLGLAWVQSTAWTLPDQPGGGFGAFVVFVVAGEFLL